MPTKTNAKQEDGNKNIQTYNCLKYKQTKRSNQKTQTDQMDTKTRPVYMLSSRDTDQVRGYKKLSMLMEIRRKPKEQF